MHGLYFLASSKVGDGAGYFEDAAVGAGGEFQALHGHAEHVERGGVGFGELMEHALRHLRIAMDTASPPALPGRKGTEALCLDVAGFYHPFANDGRGLTWLHLRELGEGHGLDFAVNVYTTEDYITPYLSQG